DGREYKEPGYVTDVITDHALEFLAGQDGASPFYLGVHYTAPHSPWERAQHPARYFDPYFDHCAFASVPDLPMHPWQIDSAPFGATPAARRELLSGYYAAITAMDANIGRLLDELDKRGLTESTLIVFTGDNGMNMGHHGVYGKGNGTYPQNMYDTSVKVPLLLACPGRIPAATVSDALFSHYDFLPSLLAFVGLEAAIPSGLPGKARAGVWTGKPDAEATEASPVVVFDEYGPARMIRDQRWKYVRRYTAHPDEFYDLAADPDETRNLIDDPSHRERIGRLRAGLDEWFTRYVAPGHDGAKLPVTGKGQLDLDDRDNVFSQDLKYLKDRSR
ncbi:MAG TPA: sulfatase-like hydrolase/transferase, partial [Rariglobus sp.]